MEQARRFYFIDHFHFYFLHHQYPYNFWLTSYEILFHLRCLSGKTRNEEPAQLFQRPQTGARRNHHADDEQDVRRDDNK
jgi:hypothetical protein